MKFSMRSEGGEELARTLNALPMALSRAIMIEALRAAAEPIRARAEQRAPRSTDNRYGHLQDHIIIGVANRLGSVEGGRWSPREGSEHAVAVGPRADFFYGLFQEYGTVYHGAQPFMRPAFDTGSGEALNILGQRLWVALRRAIPNMSGQTTSVPTGGREVFPMAA